VPTTNIENPLLMKTLKGLMVLMTACVISNTAFCQTPNSPTPTATVVSEPKKEEKKEVHSPKKWYDKISLRGYA
jgi:hypothetical protein